MTKYAWVACGYVTNLVLGVATEYLEISNNSTNKEGALGKEMIHFFTCHLLVYMLFGSMYECVA